jgi:hypothetical protein
MMKVMQRIGSVAALLTGVAIALPQIILWATQLRRPQVISGHLPTYSPEEHTDFMFSLIVGDRAVDLGPWIPIACAVGVVIMSVGVWGFWRTFKTE